MNKAHALLGILLLFAVASSTLASNKPVSDVTPMTVSMPKVLKEALKAGDLAAVRRLNERKKGDGGN